MAASTHETMLGIGTLEGVHLGGASLAEAYDLDSYFGITDIGRLPFRETWTHIVRPILWVPLSVIEEPPFDSIDPELHVEPFSAMSQIEVAHREFGDYVDRRYGRVHGTRLQLFRNFGRQVVIKAIEYRDHPPSLGSTGTDG